MAPTALCLVPFESQHADLVLVLLLRARRHSLPHAFLRVRPENTPALRCYAAAGFERVPAQEEAAFNRGQPHDYVWLRRRLASDRAAGPD